MKRISIFILISIILSGCQTNSVIDGVTNDAVIDTGNDDYYMQIAKDLYVSKQYKQSYQIASKLAENNNVEAQYLLGYLVYYGQGVPADVEQGTKWIKASADTGYRPAIEALVMIKHGLTPDNKCPSVIGPAPIKVPPANKKPSVSEKTKAGNSSLLKEGEVLITPSK